MKTRDTLHKYFSSGSISSKTELTDSKDELKEDFKVEFENLLTADVNPLLAFQLLYHRLNQVAEVAKEVFYEPAIAYLEEEDSGEHFGVKTTLKKSITWKVVKSPKIQKLEKELAKLTEQNKKVVKSYETYMINSKSITEQIKAEEKALVDQGFGTKLEEKKSISLSY